MTQFKIVSTFLFLITTFLLLQACNPSNSSNTTKLDGTKYIVCTTGMIKDVITHIVKEKGQVTALMGPGVDPHLYKASQADLRKLNEADIIIYNGLRLEGKMEDILENLAKKKPVFGMAAKLNPKDLLSDPTYHNAIDPHIWFDIEIWSKCIFYISEQLQQLHPEDASYYHENTIHYLAELKTLHQYVYSQLHLIPKEQRVLITTHDAFRYFGLAYDIEVHGLQGISTAAEVGLKDITNMVNLIIDRNLKAVFIESSVSEKTLQAVIEGCELKGHKISLGGTLYADAMGDEGSAEGTYIGMIKANVNTLVNALNQ